MTQHLTHGGLPEGMTRWQFFGLIESARRQLDLSKGTIAYLKVAFSNTMDADYAEGCVCSFWTSVTKIAAQADLDRRQVSRIESELIERGFIAKTASDHSRRCGTRKNGEIRSDFGINLAPLIDRATEIQAAAQKAAYEAEESDLLRQRIRKLFSDIRKLGFEGAVEAAEAVLPNRRPSTIQSFLRLKQVAEALEAVWRDFSAETGWGEMSYECDISPAPITKEENKQKTCSAEKCENSSKLHTTPEQVAFLASQPLQEIIALYWEAADKRERISWRTIHLAARERAYQLGINVGVWERQCDMLGADRAALCLTIADRNATRNDGYRVRDAAAAFVGMARKEARQGAVIDALVGELHSHMKEVRNAV